MLVMLHYGRCGSTVLGNQIGQHAEVLWEGELFEEMFRGRIPEHSLVRDPFQLLRLRRLYAGLRMYGMEVKFHPRYHLSAPVLDMTPEDCFGRLKAAGATHFVVLKRKNYLRQQISEEVGRQEGRWHRDADEEASFRSISLDPECIRFGGGEIPLLASFRERDAMYDRMETLLADEEALWLTFEDDVRDDPRVGYRRVCSLLDLSPNETTISTGRTNPYPVPDLLDNFDAVADCLRGTTHEWMLEQ
jgi:hypothetical protein